MSLLTDENNSVTSLQVAAAAAAVATCIYFAYSNTTKSQWFALVFFWCARVLGVCVCVCMCVRVCVCLIVSAQEIGFTSFSCNQG